jgi:uncharacterized membrane protein
MDNIGQNIVEKENQPRNIERLAAQKEIYYQAKRLFFWQLVLTVIVTVVLTLLGFTLSYFGYNIDWFRAAYGVVVTFLDLLVISPFINQLRQKAASIQELFDCDVLDLEWNKVVVGEKPLNEDIKKYSEKHLKRVKSFDKLKNWYAEPIKEVDGNAAKILCQRSNFSYDYSMRKSFLYWVVGSSIAILVLLVLFALFKDITLRAFMLTVLLPFMPVLTLSVKLYNDHNTSIKSLESLKSHILNLWAGVLNRTAQNSDDVVRQIQVKLYLNRKSNPLIPEGIYDRLRPGLEDQMYYCVEDLVEDYKKAQNKS